MQRVYRDSKMLWDRYRCTDWNQLRVVSARHRMVACALMPLSVNGISAELNSGLCARAKAPSQHRPLVLDAAGQRRTRVAQRGEALGRACPCR